MKQLFLFLFAALTGILFAPLSAQAAQSSRVCIFTPDVENVKGAEQAWLPGSVVGE